MEQRTAKINKLFGVQRAKSMVYWYYLNNNIIWRKTHMCFRSAVTTVDLPEQRVAYAQKLRKLIQKKIPLYYADESSFNAWMRVAKAFYKRQTKFVVP